jgi:hypothetical protein
MSTIAYGNTIAPVHVHLDTFSGDVLTEHCAIVMCIDGLCRPFSEDSTLQSTMYTFVGLNASTEPLTTFDLAKKTKTVAVYLSGIASVRLDKVDASITTADTVTLGLEGFEKKDDASQSSGLVIGTVVGFVSNKRCPILSIQTNQPIATGELPANYNNSKFKWVANERMYNAVKGSDITNEVKCKINAYQVKTVDLYDDGFDASSKKEGEKLVYLADGTMTQDTLSVTAPFYFAGSEAGQINNVIEAARKELAPSATGNLKVTFACKQGTITKDVVLGGAQSDDFDDGALYYVTAVTAGTASSAPASPAPAVTRSAPAVTGSADSDQQKRIADYTNLLELYENTAKSKSKSDSFVEEIYKAYTDPMKLALGEITKSTSASNEITAALDELHLQLRDMILLDLDACAFFSNAADAKKLSDLQLVFRQNLKSDALEQLAKDVQEYVQACEPKLKYTVTNSDSFQPATEEYEYAAFGVYVGTDDKYVFKKPDIKEYIYKHDTTSRSAGSDLNTFNYKDDNDVTYTYKLIPYNSTAE